MATGKITKRSVDAAQPGAGDWFLWDDEVSGFGLKVTPAGRKIFILQYRLGGRGAKVRRYTIGTMGTLTPDQARTEAKRLAALVTQGVDPMADKQERQRQEVDLAFSAYADTFLNLYAKQEWAKSYGMAEAVLRLHVTPVLKSKSLPSIKRADVTAVLDRIPVNRVALRRNVFAVLRLLLNWAVERGDIAISPIAGVKGPSAAESRDRVLTDDELRLIWFASVNMGDPFGSFYRLAMVTGQRREEVAGLVWSELDRAATVWTLPGDRSKNGEPNTIHLSPLAMGILDALADAAGCEAGKWPTKGFVFSTTDTTSISGFSKAKRKLDAAMTALAIAGGEGFTPAPLFTLPPWRVHDLRRTMATRMQALGVRWEVIEACENRISGLSRSGVSSVYQRHDWQAEKVAAFNTWSAFLVDLLHPADRSNVVPLARASGD